MDNDLFSFISDKNEGDGDGSAPRSASTSSRPSRRGISQHASSSSTSRHLTSTSAGRPTTTAAPVLGNDSGGEGEGSSKAPARNVSFAGPPSTPPEGQGEMLEAETPPLVRSKSLQDLATSTASQQVTALPAAAPHLPTPTAAPWFGRAIISRFLSAAMPGTEAIFTDAVTPTGTLKPALIEEEERARRKEASVPNADKQGASAASSSASSTSSGEDHGLTLNVNQASHLPPTTEVSYSRIQVDVILWKRGKTNVHMHMWVCCLIG